MIEVKKRYGASNFCRPIDERRSYPLFADKDDDGDAGVPTQAPDGDADVPNLGTQMSHMQFSESHRKQQQSRCCC